MLTDSSHRDHSILRMAGGNLRLQEEATPTLRDHWHAFWRSGPENIYTFIWCGILGAIVTAGLYVGSLLLHLPSNWEDRFLSAFIALLLVLLATCLQVFLRSRYKTLAGATAPLVVSADEDADIMEQRIQFYTHLDVLGEPKLTGTAPFIEFRQPLLNASVLEISFDSEIEGRIRIDGEEQKDRLEFRQTPPQVLRVQRGAYHDVVLRQWLTAEVAKKMQENVETVFDFGHTAINFGFEHRGKKLTVRKALGNQIKWTNQEREISELLATARSREARRGPDADGSRTPILNEELKAIGTLVALKTPDELAHYYARIANLWSEVKDKQEAFRMIEEYVQGHWDELIADRKERIHPWMERNFTDAVFNRRRHQTAARADD